MMAVKLVAALLVELLCCVVMLFFHYCSRILADGDVLLVLLAKKFSECGGSVVRLRGLEPRMLYAVRIVSECH
jgi:hypothetical protein